MGCFVSKDNTGENILSSNKVHSLKEKLLASHIVVTLELLGANNLKKMPMKLFRSQGPYFEFELKPTQSLGDEQKF